ncbi:MAG: hypothetical protein GY711_08285 [bacterium]|nr:hypothetical protein [bacterium]
MSPVPVALLGRYVLAAIAGVGSTVAAALAQDGVGRIPVRVVAGKLVVSCDASSPSRRIPVNLFVEFETACGMQLHNRAAAGLRIETSDGRAIPVTLHLPGFELVVPKREHGDEPFLEEFTKYHAAELGENAVVGVIGAEVLENYHVVFDVAEGVMELSAPRARDTEPPPVVEGTTNVPITLQGGMAWLPVRYGDGQPAALAIGSARYDTWIDATVCDERGKPAGDIGPLTIEGGIDVAKFVALRPEEVILVHPDSVAGVTGLGFLKHFRVEVDRTNRLAKLTQRARAEFPEADLAFFRARVDEEPEPLLEFLAAHEGARLAHEAAELLLDLSLSEDPEADAIQVALEWIRDTTVEDLRATRLLDLMTGLADEGFPRWVVAAGELAIPSGRDDRYPEAVHNVHSKMGEVLLAGGEGRRAWRHLLSAAFGIPEDGMVNLNLGRYYESEGRYKRAFSRYVQASIKVESGPAAIEALERVQPMLPDEDPFSVDLVERMIEGKVRGFGTATRFEADEINFAGRVALVEFFTNAYMGDGSRGAIGGALGNQGLLGHFPPENVAFLSYHLFEPNPDPMVNALSDHVIDVRGIERPMHLINGTAAQPGAGRWRDGEEIYNRCRKAIQLALLEQSSYALKLDARFGADGALSGTFTIEGPERDELDVNLILAERAVLFPGKTEVVVHRMVARASLLDAVDTAYRPTDESMAIPFTVDLGAIVQANVAFLDELEADGGGSVVRMSTAIDPAQVRLVGCIRNARTGEVLQAIQIDPEGPEERTQ